MRKQNKMWAIYSNIKLLEEEIKTSKHLESV